MKDTYTPGATVRYPHQMPYGHAAAWNCGDYTHYGIVMEVLPDNGGDQVVTVEFDCGYRDDIPAGDLQPTDN